MKITLATASLVAAAALVAPAVVSADVYTPTQTQLLEMDDVTAGFGGTGTFGGAAVSGDGVIYDVTLGTTGDPKIAIRNNFGPAELDLSGFDTIEVDVELISGGPLFVRAFTQDGNFDPFLQSAGVTLDNVGETGTMTILLDDADPDTFDQSVVRNLGFQFFTSMGQGGGVASQVLVTPTVVPEPAAAASILGLGMIGLKRIRR